MIATCALTQGKIGPIWKSRMPASVTRWCSHKFAKLIMQLLYVLQIAKVGSKFCL